MSKLIDNMKTMGPAHPPKNQDLMPERYIEQEGGPCPFCDGERSVVVYIHVQVKTRNHRAEGQKGSKTVAMPGFWQGICRECVQGILLDLGERSKREDYLSRLKEFLGVQGSQ